MIFTRRNFTKVFAVTIPVFVFMFMNRPLEHLLNGVITNPTTEEAIIIVISSMIITIIISIVAVLICIKIWNRQMPKL